MTDDIAGLTAEDFDAVSEALSPEERVRCLKLACKTALTMPHWAPPALAERVRQAIAQVQDRDGTVRMDDFAKALMPTMTAAERRT